MLGNPDGALLEVPIPLVPILGDVVGAEDTLRVLSPFPENADPRVSAVLAGIHAFLDRLAT